MKTFKKHHDQINLGQLIDLLELMPPDKAIRFDFCQTQPDGLSSYRGYYEDVAIAWKAQEDYPGYLVKDFFAYLMSKLGKTVSGYKGGDYKIIRGSWLWVSNWGDTSDTVITGVRRGDFIVYITTACMEIDD